MKLSLSTLLNPHSKFASQKAFRLFFSSTSTQILSSPKLPQTLYRRISPVGDPNISIVPVLDQWVREGKEVQREELQWIIKELKFYRRYKHALEVSQWMTDKRYIPLMTGDIADRLNLISRVHGLEQAEKYFENIPQILKGYEVYWALLNCFAHGKAVEKSETFMQKLRDMGYARTPWSYNIMMTLYYKMESWEKLDSLVHEMEEKGIYFDYYTYGIRLSAYAAASDIEGMDNIVTKMESDHRVTLDYYTYGVAADGYLKVGLLDKALTMLSKLEGQMISTKKRNVAFDCLLRLYARTGKKDELHRIWNLYKKEKIFNNGYMAMMSSLLKFNAIEDAEKIFEEWESRGLTYDFRIPNYLIDVYCRNGLLGKAESLLEKG
ncbi:unnamed protein product [Ilex paraguariensis]|uniref:Pentatricopeptide repeat-containing protein n=1 Tax=Ilex paraguariensis TaxID=185542 RepID=A0ABC8U771_9AQUA